MNEAAVSAEPEAQKIDLSPVQEQLQRLEEVNREEAAEQARHAEEHDRRMIAVSEEVQLHQANVERIQERKQSIMEDLRIALENVEGFDLEAHFNRALETREAYNLSNDDAPTPEQMQKWFTPEREAAIRKLRNPVSGLRCKSESFEQGVEAIDASDFVENKTYVNGDVFKPQETQEDGWEFWVIDGPQEMDVASYDDTDKILNERIAAVQEYRAQNGLSGFDRNKSVLLFMHSLRTGNPVDQEYYTLLDEDEAYEKGNIVPFSDWSDDRAYFGRLYAVWRRGNARFRSSVGGDVVS